MSVAGITRTGLNADGQVVNLRHKTFLGNLTTESTTKRGVAPGQARLMPEAIYRLARGNRDEAIRLLRQYRFIL